MREGLLPAVVARLVLDNTNGKQTKTAMFALNHARPGERILEDDLGAGRLGFAFRREAGGAAELFDCDVGNKAAAADRAVCVHALVGERRRSRAL